jgi:2-methylcitrate dehydratase PrpD
MHETRVLAEFVDATEFTDLPATLVDDLKIIVLDTFAAAFIGTAQPWARMVVDMVHELGGAPDATVIHQTWRTDISRAALANGALIGAFECEPLTGSHASGTVLPAALAVCESEGLDGQAFLTALALGFEVSARIARTAVGLESARGFHNPGTQGTFGAAAAVGKLYALSQETLTSAFGIAGSGSAGLLEFAWTGADTKRLHLGRAGQLGLESALLAQKGFRGPPTVLEGRYGYYNAFSLPTKLDRLLEELGETWVIQPPSLKSYPVHVTQQAVVQAIQAYKQEHALDPRHITRIVIRGDPHIMDERHAVREPETVMGGQYSLPFTAAVAFTRDLANPLAYDDDAVKDPLVRELARRIELLPVEPSEHPEPGVYAAEILLEYEGRSATLPTSPHKGSPRNPFTWDEVCAKFQRSTATLIGPKQAAALIEAVRHLEQLDNMAEVAEALAPQ